MMTRHQGSCGEERDWVDGLHCDLLVMDADDIPQDILLDPVVPLEGEWRGQVLYHNGAIFD